jgi:uncharacterized iron-regulated protein
MPCVITRFITLPVAFVLGGLFVWQSPQLAAESNLAQGYQEGQIWEAATGKVIAFEDFARRLSAPNVIYIGEEHRNRSHIEAALKVLQSLSNENRRPILGLEMFSWDGQAGLDHYLSTPEMTMDTFLQEARWDQNWGGAYLDYQPLVGFARVHHLPVIALNPPRPMVREIAKNGFEKARRQPAMSQWGVADQELVEDPGYRDKILKQLRSCHEGLSDAAYQRMYEASVFRDEGMAKAIVDQLRHLPNAAGPIVSYTGGGHIQYGLPVPNRVTRRYGAPVRQVTIYLAALDPARTDAIQELLKSTIADYVWLTPASTHESSRRCL